MKAADETFQTQKRKHTPAPAATALPPNGLLNLLPELPLAVLAASPLEELSLMVTTSISAIASKPGGPVPAPKPPLCAMVLQLRPLQVCTPFSKIAQSCSRWDNCAVQTWVQLDMHLVSAHGFSWPRSTHAGDRLDGDFTSSSHADHT